MTEQGNGGCGPDSPSRGVLARMRLDPEMIFDSSSRHTDLTERSVLGGLSTMGGQLLRTAIQMGSVVVLARLLTPGDYGLVGMVTVVIGFAKMFKDAGLSTATVQKHHVSREQISTLFWVNLGVSVALGATVLCVSPLVALFYARPELTAMTAVLSASFLIDGVSIQHEALLRRHMRFLPVAVSQVVAQTANACVAVVAALLGARYWALVLGTLASSFVLSAMTIFFCPWIPGKMRRGVGTRSMLRFGGDVTLFSFINYFGENSDYMLLGKFAGADALGLYTRAYQLFFLPVTQMRIPMSAVAMPALSALRTDPQRYARFYRRFLEVLGLLTVPIAVYCLLEADFIIRVLLGAQWMGVVPIFQLLAIAGVVQAVASTRGLVLTSCGLSKQYVQLGFANTIVRILGVLVGLPFGIVGVAAGTSAAVLVFLAPSLHFFTKGTPVAPNDFYRALAKPLLYAAVAGLLGLAARHLLSGDGALKHVVVTAIFVAAYVGLIGADSSARADLRQFVGIMRVRSRQ